METLNLIYEYSGLNKSENEKEIRRKNLKNNLNKLI